MFDIEEEQIDIPIETDHIILKGSIYFSKNTPERAPFVINMAGLLDHRESYFVKLYSEKFAEHGFYVLSYDYRAHGKTAKQTGRRWDKMLIQIFDDIIEVINWIIINQSNRLQNSKIILFGRSIGGAIILTRGFSDPRVGILIALCTRYDYHSTTVKFPEEIIQKVSPHYFLKNDPPNKKRILIAHCKDDPRIPFENFTHIKNHLSLSDDNAIQYDTGGHSFKGHRDEIFKISIEFINKYL